MRAPEGRQTYVVRQLQSWNDEGWAVIALPAGAIALRDDRLLMKLTKDEAEKIAAELVTDGGADGEG